jgi:hypothetical protein
MSRLNYLKHNVIVITVRQYFMLKQRVVEEYNLALLLYLLLFILKKNCRVKNINLASTCRTK